MKPHPIHNFLMLCLHYYAEQEQEAKDLRENIDRKFLRPPLYFSPENNQYDVTINAMAAVSRFINGEDASGFLEIAEYNFGTIKHGKKKFFPGYQ